MRTIPTLVATLVVYAAVAVPAQASSTVTGDPWIDQYIEQVPTAGGGVSGGDHRPTGLSKHEVSALADAGGDQFAAVTAAVVPASDALRPARKSGRNPADRTNVPIPSMGSAVVSTFSGSGGGLGPVLPAALLGGLVAAIAFSGIRLHKSGS